MTEIYLDNAATTRTDPDLAEDLARDMVELYANPSSAHRPGLAAARRLAEARRGMEACFPERRIVLTASGSEALNLAMKGAFARRRKGADRIVYSAVEHPAVINCAKQLAEAHAARPEAVAVDGDGRLDLAAFERALGAADDVAIVALMHVQNELGTVEPVAEAGRLVRKLCPRAHFLVDAVQGLGKLPVDPAGWDADTAAIASHKIHGPKGMGALITRKDPALVPLVAGGGQEGGLRSGTENVAGAVAFARATTRAVEGLAENQKRLAGLRERLRSKLIATVDDVAENGPAGGDPAVRAGRTSPAILNLSFRGVPSEVLLHALEGDGIYVSAGSACHSKGKPHNHIHAAARLPEWRSLSAIRFGLSWHTTEAEIDRTAAAVRSRVAELRRLVGAK